MKICIRCKLPKSLEEFGNYARYPDGKHRYCRQCWNANSNKWRHAHGTKPLMPLLDRLWDGIQTCGHEEACLYCCWPWTHGKDADGYGKIAHTVNRRITSMRVTRVVYEIWNGIPIPDDKLVCHFCDFPSCSNPLHFWLGTANENRQDCVKKGRAAKGLAAGVHTKPEAFAHLRGESRPHAKLTEEGVRIIRTRYSQGNITAQQLGEAFGVSKFTVWCVLHRKTWKHVD